MSTKDIIITAITVFFVLLAVVFVLRMIFIVYDKKGGGKKYKQNKKAKLSKGKVSESHLRSTSKVEGDISKSVDNLKGLKDYFKKIFMILREISSFEVEQREVVTALADNEMNYAATERLKALPIEEINKDKIGIRVKLLKDKGIKTVYDAYKWRNRDFSKISGISPSVSQMINKKIDQLVIRNKESVRVRLSIDDKSKLMADLLRHLDIYLSSLLPIKKARELLSLEKDINDLFKEYNRNKRNESQLKGIKDNLIDISLSFKNINEDIIIPFNNAKRKTVVDGYKDYENNSILFATTLETLIKSAAPKEVSVLPTQLLKSIEEQPLDLRGFKLSLRNYQEWGAKYIIKQRKCILGDEMGLGKTVQAIACFTHLRNEGKKYFMVICPLSVLTNWCREIEKFTDVRYIAIYGNNKVEEFNDYLLNGGIGVTTYETLSALEFPTNLKIDLLVVDEAHLVKHKEALRSQKTKQYVDISERVTYMTGTVIENNLGEMIKLVNDLKPMIAHELTSKNVYFNDEAFKKIIAPIYFRRRREDVLTELPEKIENEEWCDLTTEERNIYKESILNHSFAESRRVSWNVSLSKSTKMNRLKEIIDMAKLENRKVLVFSYFLDTIFSIKEYLGNIALPPIYGEVPTSERQAIIDEFDKSEGGTVLLSQIISGGTGLNIQSASVVVICEPQFKPSIENQAISRAYRMGQARNVLVYRLLATDTVDERITQLLKNKQQEFDAYADESVSALSSFELDKNSIFAQEVEKLSKE